MYTLNPIRPFKNTSDLRARLFKWTCNPCLNLIQPFQSVMKTQSLPLRNTTSPMTNLPKSLHTLQETSKAPRKGKQHTAANVLARVPQNGAVQSGEGCGGGGKEMIRQRLPAPRASAGRGQARERTDEGHLGEHPTPMTAPSRCNPKP